MGKTITNETLDLVYRTAYCAADFMRELEDVDFIDDYDLKQQVIRALECTFAIEKVDGIITPIDDIDWHSLKL